MVVGREKGIEVWDVVAQKKLTAFAFAQIDAAALSPGGKALAVPAADGGVYLRVYDLRRGDGP